LVHVTYIYIYINCVTRTKENATYNIWPEGVGGVPPLCGITHTRGGQFGLLVMGWRGIWCLGSSDSRGIRPPRQPLPEAKKRPEKRCVLGDICELWSKHKE
jgi:hypothetical protein